MSEYKDGRGDYYLAEGKREEAAHPVDSAEALLRQLAEDVMTYGNDPKLVEQARAALQASAPSPAAEPQHGPFGNEGYCRCGYFIGHYGNPVKRWDEHFALRAAAEGSEPLDVLLLLDAKWRDDYAITMKFNHQHRDGNRVAHDITEWCPDLRLRPAAYASQTSEGTE